MKTRKLELYNLKEDIGELKDLARLYPDKVKQLAKMMSDKFRGWEAAMPTYKSNGEPVAWADEL